MTFIKKITSCYTINPVVFLMEIWCFYEVCNELFKHNDEFCTLEMVQPNHLLLRRLQFILSTHLEQESWKARESVLPLTD